MQRNLTKLKPKRERFVTEYLLDYNATQAAIRAGYSDHCADVIAAELMRNDLVKAEIEKRIAAYKKKYEIKREYIVEKLFKLIQDAETDSDRATLIKSLDMLNKMSGNYTTTVVNVNVEQPLFPDTPSNIIDITPEEPDNV